MAKKRPTNGPVAKNGPAPALPAATYFLSITLHNIRCFAEPQTLDLFDGQGRPARWTVLLGNNGTGKTTVLQALAACEGRRHELPSGLIWRTARPFGSHSFAQVIRQTREQANLTASVAFGSPLTVPGECQRCEFAFRMSVDDTSQWRGDSEASQALICYGYGASRRWGDRRLSPTEGEDATATLFSDDAPLRDAEDWLLRLDYSTRVESRVQEQQRQRLAQVKEMLLAILPEVEDLRFAPPTSVDAAPTLEFHTPDGWVRLSQLGHGYRTLIAWMVDFASRLIERYPDLPNPLHAPAVCLVDEVDLHLHPLWQRQLMGYLTHSFPNTQFIVTAHSPLVVQAAAEGGKVVLLRREGDHVVIEDDVKTVHGWRVDQLLTSDLFGLPSARPPQLDAVFERRKELLGRSKLTRQERQELDDLEEQVRQLPLGESAKADQAMKAIEDTIRLLEKHQGRPE